MGQFQDSVTGFRRYYQSFPGESDDPPWPIMRTPYLPISPMGALRRPRICVIAVPAIDRHQLHPVVVEVSFCSSWKIISGWIIMANEASGDDFLSVAVWKLIWVNIAMTDEKKLLPFLLSACLLFSASCLASIRSFMTSFLSMKWMIPFLTA